MPDILTHVLVGYVLGTTLSFRREWLTPPLVTVVMLGALVPDLSKIDLLLLGEYVETLLGVPFEWRARRRECRRRRLVRAVSDGAS